MKKNELTTLRKKALSMIEAPVALHKTIKYVIENGQLFNGVNATKNVLATNLKDFDKNSDDWCDYINNLGIKDAARIKIAMAIISNDVPVSITDKIFNYV